jgi:apolipoprotein N-acyltransferase
LTPQEIIVMGRSAPARSRGALWLSLASAGMMWASFTPLDFSPLGWICLVPLLLLVRLPRPTKSMYRVTYLGGLAFWLPALQWMRLGDPSMYFAWFALAAYLAVYFPVFVGLTRIALHRLRVPLVLAAPIVWVGLEYLRGTLLSGFAWYNLSHSQYRWIELIQISDLVGAYGVSFVMAATAAAVAEFLPASLITKLRLLQPVTGQAEVALPQLGRKSRIARLAVSLGLVAATLGYGYARRSGAEFPAGPRVAAVQGNVPISLHSADQDWREVYLRHRELTGKAVQLQPELIVWPEVMFPFPLHAAPLDLSDEELQAAVPEFPVGRWHEPQVPRELSGMSQQAAAALVIGIQTFAADRQGLKVFNSALFVRPDTGISGRYDKIHRVPFGEYVPLSGLLARWGIMPYRGQFGLTAGTRPEAFEYKDYRYAPIICFEDTDPQLVRRVVESTMAADPQHRRVDVLLNLTNDGWFHGSSELDQHLITAAFRSVECRTPMVRAVNTGISAVIDGDGVIRARATDPTTKRSKQVEAVLVENIPLDRRFSPYVAYGDWFAGLCLTACGLVLAAGLLRFPRRQAAPQTKSPSPFGGV